MLFAFTGKRGHGKSTAAEALVRNMDYVHLNFADPLRQIANLAYGVSYEEMLDPVAKEQVLDRWPFKSPRNILQQIGTDMFRAYVDDTWVENFKLRVADAMVKHERYTGHGDFEPDGPAGVVNSDTRFLNEAAAVRAMGGKIIKIVDPRKDRKDAAAQHQSEMEIDQIIPDWTVVNDRGVRDLEIAVLDIVGCATPTALLKLSA